MFFLCCFKMAGITGDLLALQCLIAEMNFMFKANLLRVLDFLLCDGFNIVTAGLQAGPIGYYRTYGEWRIRVIQVGR